MNKSDRLIVYVIDSTMLLIYLFQCSLFHTEIFECVKITSWSHKKFCNFALKGIKCRLQFFMCIWSNKCKISRKNSKCLLRKWQTTLGDTFFAAYCSSSSSSSSSRLIDLLVDHVVDWSLHMRYRCCVWIQCLRARTCICSCQVI